VEFGIAKVESVASVGASMAGQPTMIMTPGYASLEQLTGESSGKASDIYSPADRSPSSWHRLERSRPET
jgi:serine/threonine protein kinase